MSALEIRTLTAAAAHQHLDALAAVLCDCVEGGASVSYMAPFTHEQARAAFAPVIDAVQSGSRLLLAAFVDGTVVGTVQLVHAAAPNQPHRADVAKLLVHRSARGRGVGRALMERLEDEAGAAGRTLLVLDTVTGDAGERLYLRLGWHRLGVIPNFALYPDGRPCDTTVLYKQVTRESSHEAHGSGVGSSLNEEEDPTMLDGATAHATLPALDMERATKFYTEKVGATPSDTAQGGSFFSVGNSTFSLYPTPNPNRGGHTQMGLRVSDVRASVAELRSRGIEFEEYDFPGLKTVDGIADIGGGGAAAWFKDTEGNIVGVVQI